MIEVGVLSLLSSIVPFAYGKKIEATTCILTTFANQSMYWMGRLLERE